ncbi:hypothetical protein PVK06_029760 [Gossypium arboreum]|uniref:Uncharacterized protein n=1 Tax=Gossypium arboreum TaxID=29729 RepID=A0ABR0NMG9_GOSAR|nr:hypothetical protein PVK06_029760 [Gossypium arboreum]
MDDSIANLKIHDGRRKFGRWKRTWRKRLLENKDPMEIPLTYSFFWVQIHDMLLEMISEAITKQFGDFIGSFVEYDAK